MNLPNFHVLIVKYFGPTRTLPSRIKIISERFEQETTFQYNSASGDSFAQAEEWLIKNGHNVIGHGQGKGHFYVICAAVNNLFQPLK